MNPVYFAVLRLSDIDVYKPDRVSVNDKVNKERRHHAQKNDDHRIVHLFRSRIFRNGCGR